MTGNVHLYVSYCSSSQAESPPVCCLDQNLEEAIVSSSPISKVPDDILNIVFEDITTPSYPEWAVTEQLRMSFTLAAVSRRWRRLLISNRKLWASLVVADLLPQTVDIILTRAGTHPLTLWVAPLENGPRISTDKRAASHAKVFECIPRCKSIHIRVMQPGDILARQAFIDAVTQRGPVARSFTLDLRSYSSQTPFPLEGFNLFAPPPPVHHSTKTTHPLRTLHLRGLPAHAPSLSVANLLPNVTSLVLQGSPRVAPGVNSYGHAHHFTPQSFINFIRPMTDLRVLVLDNILQWSEPSVYDVAAIQEETFRRAVYSQAPADLANTVDLPALTNLEVTTEVFTAARFLAGLKDLGSSCRITLRIFANTPATWDLDRFKDALRSLLRMVTKERDIETWSFAFGRVLLIRAEKQGRVLCDVRADLLDFFIRATPLAELYVALEDTLPQFLENWDLESATTLRLRLEPDSPRGVADWSGNRWDFARAIFRRCTSVSKLHLHGVSLAAFCAIGDSYFLPPFTLHHTLPNLLHIVVIASSFGHSADSSSYQYLANILAIRAGKRGASRISTYMLVDNLTGEDGYNILNRSVTPHFSRSLFDGITFGWTDAEGYHRSDPGVRLDCDSCRLSGFWYSVATDAIWRLEGEHVVRKACDCALKIVS